MNALDIIKMENVGGEPEVSSRTVAKHFKKEHFNVLRDIENLIDVEHKRLQKQGVRELNYGGSKPLNFKKVSYISRQGKEMPMYFLGLKEFSVLAMGFTGEKAHEWKLLFFDAFEEMAAHIQNGKIAPTDLSRRYSEIRKVTKKTRLELTDVIKFYLIPMAVEQGSKNSDYFYVNYSKLILKEFAKDTGVVIPKGHTIRDYLEVEDLMKVYVLEEALVTTIMNMTEMRAHYKSIYQECKEFVQMMANKLKPFRPALTKRNSLLRLT